jgi:hypothetical protein
LDDGGGEGIRESVKWEMGGELPNGEKRYAEDGAADDE